MPDPRPVVSKGDDVVLRVRVNPRSSRSLVQGLHNGALKISLKAPPVDGKANTELCRFLAKRLGLPRASVVLVAGRSSRSKTVRISGLPAADVKTALGVPG